MNNEKTCRWTATGNLECLNFAKDQLQPSSKSAVILFESPLLDGTPKPNVGKLSFSEDGSKTDNQFKGK